MALLPYFYSKHVVLAILTPIKSADCQFLGNISIR